MLLHITIVLLLTITVKSFHVESWSRISGTEGGFDATLDVSDYFGSAVAGGFDFDNDGTLDFIVGSMNDDDGESNAGAVYVLLMNPNGTVKSWGKISATEGGFDAQLGSGDVFGRAVAGGFDFDNDGTLDFLVSAMQDDDGGPNKGAVYLLLMHPNITVKSWTKISETEGGFDVTLDDSVLFGSSVAGGFDFDDDGTLDFMVGAHSDNDGGSKAGAAYLLLMQSNGTVKSWTKISATQGNFNGALNADDRFGSSATGGFDFNEDGIPDFLVGAAGDENYLGAVYLLLMQSNGTVKSWTKISATEGGLTATFEQSAHFGYSASGGIDYDGDGTTDFLVGAINDEDTTGAVYLLLMKPDGTVKSWRRMDKNEGGLNDSFSDITDSGYRFAFSLAAGFDFYGDGSFTFLAGTPEESDQRGSVYLISFKSPCFLDSQCGPGGLCNYAGICFCGSGYSPNSGLSTCINQSCPESSQDVQITPEVSASFVGSNFELTVDTGYYQNSRISISFLDAEDAECDNTNMESLFNTSSSVSELIYSQSFQKLETECVDTVVGSIPWSSLSGCFSETGNSRTGRVNVKRIANKEYATGSFSKREVVDYETTILVTVQMRQTVNISSSVTILELGAGISLRYLITSSSFDPDTLQLTLTMSFQTTNPMKLKQLNPAITLSGYEVVSVSVFNDDLCTGAEPECTQTVDITFQLVSESCEASTDQFTFNVEPICRTTDSDPSTCSNSYATLDNTTAAITSTYEVGFCAVAYAATLEQDSFEITPEVSNGSDLQGTLSLSWTNEAGAGINTSRFVSLFLTESVSEVNTLDISSSIQDVSIDTSTPGTIQVSFTYPVDYQTLSDNSFNLEDDLKMVGSYEVNFGATEEKKRSIMQELSSDPSVEVASNSFALLSDEELEEASSSALPIMIPLTIFLLF